MYWHYDHRLERITNYESQIMNFGQAVPVPISGQGTLCPTGAKDDGEGPNGIRSTNRYEALRFPPAFLFSQNFGSEEPMF